MNVTIKKIEAMHRRFGKIEDKKCGDCCNLVFHRQGKKYFKCALYGTSSSLSTDWVKKWTACGMFNKEQEPRKKGTLSITEPDDKPMDGQMELEVSHEKSI